MKARLLTFLFPVGCAAIFACCIRKPELPPPPPPPMPPTPGIYYEENLQPEPTVRLEIIGLDDAKDPATQRVTVTGTLVNRGTRPTAQVSVKVTALDENGDEVISVAAVPSTDRIGAEGGTATFTADLGVNPAIRSYHVEAIAK